MSVGRINCAIVNLHGCAIDHSWVAWATLALPVSFGPKVCWSNTGKLSLTHATQPLTYEGAQAGGTPVNAWYHQYLLEKTRERN